MAGVNANALKASREAPLCNMSCKENAGALHSSMCGGVKSRGCGVPGVNARQVGAGCQEDCHRVEPSASATALDRAKAQTPS